MTIERDYYPIAEAAQTIGCTVDDLIHLGAKWGIFIYALFESQHQAWTIVDSKEAELVTLDHGPYELNPFDLQALEAGNQEWLTVVHSGTNGYRLCRPHLGAPIPLPSKLVIMRKDIERLQEEQAHQPVVSQADESDGVGSGEHESDGLRLLRRASRVFWANADKSDRTTQPSNEEVSAWLQENRMTQRQANVGASIIRPNWAGKGRKPSE